jgi:hypothetical protein
MSSLPLAEVSWSIVKKSSAPHSRTTFSVPAGGNVLITFAKWPGMWDAPLTQQITLTGDPTRLVLLETMVQPDREEISVVARDGAYILEQDQILFGGAKARAASAAAAAAAATQRATESTFEGREALLQRAVRGMVFSWSYGVASLSMQRAFLLNSLLQFSRPENFVLDEEDAHLAAGISARAQALRDDVGAIEILHPSVQRPPMPPPVCASYSAVQAIASLDELGGACTELTAAVKKQAGSLAGFKGDAERAIQAMLLLSAEQQGRLRALKAEFETLIGGVSIQIIA